MFLDFRFLIATVFHVPFLSWLGCNYSTQNCCTGSSGLDFRSQLHQVTMVTLSRTSFHLTDSIWFSTEWIYCFTSHISSHSSLPKQINNLERWIWATWGQRRGWRKRFRFWRKKTWWKIYLITRKVRTRQTSGRRCSVMEAVVEEEAERFFHVIENV